MTEIKESTPSHRTLKTWRCAMFVVQFPSFDLSKIPSLVAMLAALMFSMSCQPAAASMLTVSAEGVLLKDGQPYRAIGVNIFDAFVRLWEHGDVTYDRDFATLEAEGIPFARIAATYYSPDAMMQYVEHREDYLAKLDGVVASAERHHVGLIMDLFFWDAAIPDVVHEPRSAWGDPNSKTIAFMREYTHTIVARYKDSPAVWAWEFGNEYSLSADLPNAAQWRPEINPSLGWPTKRTKADDLTTKMILVAFEQFGKAVRDIDPVRAITSGNSVPRQSAERVADLLPEFQAALKTASRGTIRTFQKLLADKGFKPGAVNGKMGLGTTRALSACLAAGSCTAG